MVVDGVNHVIRRLKLFDPIPTTERGEGAGDRVRSIADNHDSL